MRALIAVVVLFVLGATATVISGWRAAHSEGRRRWAWRILAVALGLAVLANALGLLIGLTVLPVSWGMAINPILVFTLLMAIGSLVLFPPARPRGLELARLILDGLLVGGSALLVASTTIFPTLLSGHRGSLQRSAEVLALPVLDLVIVTMATLLIALNGRSGRVPLVLLGSALLMSSISDMAYAVDLSLGHVGLGSWWNLGWFSGYVLVSAAALHPMAGISPDRQEDYVEAGSVRSAAAFFAVFVVAAATTIGRAALVGLTPAMRAVWAAVILILVVRQLVLVVDNDRLRRSLESRVEERTKRVRAVTLQRALLVSSVADGIYSVDRDGRIRTVNQAAARLLKRPAVDLVGASAHELFHGRREGGTSDPSKGCHIAQALAGVTTSAEEEVYLRGDGRAIVVEATTSPLHDDDSHHVTGAVVVFRDISERHEMERMKREFVSVVSHELRTPLTSIRGALGLIAGGALGTVPASIAKMVDIASAGSERLSLLVNDLLEIDRLDTGSLPLSMTTCAMASVCADAIDATQGIARASDVHLRSGAIGGQVVGDRDRLIQVLINLIGNAVRFSDPGDSVVVEARPVGDRVQVAVIDTGRGIPADKLEDVFDRFNQVDSSDAREREGTGLGLAICRGLVEAMGGRIWAESTLGQGSTFRFELPSADPDPASERPAHEELSPDPH